MSTKNYLFILLATATLSARAQTSDTASATLLDEVIVTANKLPQKQSSTGKVVSVITKEMIEKSSGRTLPQLLNEQAGISINGALNTLGSNQTLYMRGASSGRTLFLLDGIPVSDPSYINNDFDINLISLNNVERVEISRGAQSTLYGSDAIAGVINIITINKDIEKLVNLKSTVSGGNYGTFRGNVQLYGKADKLTYSTRYAKLLTNGFSSAHDSTGKNNFDNDGYDGDVVSGSVQYQLMENFSLRSFVQHSQYKTDLDAGLFKDEKDYNAKSKILLAGGGFTYKKNIVTLTGNYQYSENKRNYFNDSIDVPGFSTFSTDDFKGRSQFLELYSSIKLGKNITLLQGADYRFNNMSSNFYSLSMFGPFEAAFKDTSHSQSSLYASVLINDDKEYLNVELGGRLNVHSSYGTNYTFTFNPSYKLSNQVRVFGSIASGFKAPTLYQLFSSFGKKDLQPERSINYELGLQHTHKIINSRLVYFNREIKDGIDFNNSTFKYYNFIKQNVAGLEFETRIVPVDRLNITANYSYINPNEISQSRVSFKDTTYSHLLRRPQHIANISIGYQFNNGLYVSASTKYTGKRFDVGGYMVNDILLDNYFLLNAYAEYKIKENWKVFVDAQNLANKKFFDIRGYNSIPFLINVGVMMNL